MDDISFIIGLMRQNSNALGFIPDSTLQSRYIPNNQYIIQRTNNQIGYLLHGTPKPGQILSITQAVIEFDFRQRGHGMDIVNQLIERARINNCRAITLGCADDLAANQFWIAAGFEHTAILPPNNRRKRKKNIYTFDLWPTLFKQTV